MNQQRKLWKVMSFSKTKGNRISKSLPYADALAQFTKYRAELEAPERDGDTLYMVQVLEVAVGRANISMAEEIDIQAPTWLNGQSTQGPFDRVAAKR